MYQILFKKITSFITLAAFLLSCVPPLYAQSLLDLPKPGSLVALSPASDPLMLRGIKVDPQHPLNIDFILDQGNDPSSKDELSSKAEIPVRDFLAALTIPEDDLWVNLSPYEKDRIIPDAFSLTEMGRSFLEQDYLLKQLTASMLHPDSALGKRFWDKVYADAYARYGTTDIPLDTFNKVWITPATATVYESDRAAFVVEAKFKVMMEEDYLALKEHPGMGTMPSTDQQLTQIGRDALREIIIPALEREVNEGAAFGRLRQIYHALLLGLWFKKKLKGSSLDTAYFGRNKVEGISTHDPQFSARVYQTYLEAFHKGVYNFIRDESDHMSGEVLPRKYFSGGVNFTDCAQKTFFTRAQDSLKGVLRTGFFVLAMTASVTALAQTQVTSLTLNGEKVLPDSTSIAAVIADAKSTTILRQGGLLAGRVHPIKKIVMDRKSNFLGDYSNGLIVMGGAVLDPQGVPVSLGRDVYKVNGKKFLALFSHEQAHSWGVRAAKAFTDALLKAMQVNHDAKGLELVRQAQVYFATVYVKDRNALLLKLAYEEDPEARKSLRTGYFNEYPLNIKSLFKSPLSEGGRKTLKDYLIFLIRTSPDDGVGELPAYILQGMVTDTSVPPSADELQELLHAVVSNLLVHLQENPEYDTVMVNFINDMYKTTGSRMHMDPEAAREMLKKAVKSSMMSKNSASVERMIASIAGIAREFDPHGVYKAVPDFAQDNAPADKGASTGGIDLTADNTPLKVTADGQMADLNIHGPIKGLSSRITGIASLADLWGFLEVAPVH